MISIGRGLGEGSVVATWFKHLSGQQQTEGFHFDNSSQFVKSAAEALPSLPVPRVLPRILSHEEAPYYAESLPGEAQWAMIRLPEAFMECRLVARDLDLLSALLLIGQTDTDREYAVERVKPTGRYQIVSGFADLVFTVYATFLCTHRDQIALPSKLHLEKMEALAEAWKQPWSYIYSRPSNEHQLSYIVRRRPYVYDITLCRDRPDPMRGKRELEERNFLVRAVIDPKGVGDGKISGLDVRELSKEGPIVRIVKKWQFNGETYPDLDVQKFWKDVIG